MKCVKCSENKKGNAFVSFIVTVVGLTAALLTIAAFVPKVHDKLVGCVLRLTNKKDDFDYYNYEPKIVSKQEADSMQEDNYNGI